MQRHSTLKKICNAQKSCQDDPILSVMKRFTEHSNLISLQHSEPGFSFNLPIQTKLLKENKSVCIYTWHSQKSKKKLFVFFHKFYIKILITRYLFQFYHLQNCHEILKKDDFNSSILRARLMRPEVNSNRFQKSFRLLDDFTCKRQLLINHCY